MIIADKIWGLVRGSISMGFQQLRKTLVDAFSMVTSYHNESMKFARSAGMSLQQANAYTKVLTTRAAELGVKYGLAASEVQNLERSLQNAVTRQLMLSDTQAEKMVQINRLVGESVNSAYSEQMVTKMGAQIDTVQGAVAKGYATALKSGLNAEKMTQKISQNLGMANRLSFRNGVDGLTRMAMLSEKLGVNMQSVETAAGNFMELDKAIEHAAQLQMLGGSAGAMFGNPLTAAYEANYDPEAFAKRMSDSLASYATFDASKGISNINGMNMDFVRNIAKAMGISAEEAASMAKKQAEVRYKENTYGTTLDAMSGGDQMKRDMLINKSTIQNGKLGMVDSKQQWHEMSYYQSGEGKKEMDDMMSMYGKSDSEIMQEQAVKLQSIDEQLRGIWTSLTAKIGEVLNEWGVLPWIQNFIDKHGKELVEKVGTVAVQVGEKIPEYWKWLKEKWNGLKEKWNTAKSFGNTILTVLKWGFGLWVGGKVLSGLNKVGKLFNFGSRGANAAPNGGGFLNGAKNLIKKPFSFGKSLVKDSVTRFRDVKAGYQLSRGANGAGTGLGRVASLIKGVKLAGSVSKLAKGSGILAGGIAAIQGVTSVIGYNKNKSALNDALQSGQISKGDYDAKLRSAQDERNKGIGGAIGGVAGAAIGTALAGPIGAAIGGFIGDKVGGFIGKNWNNIKDGAKKAGKWLADNGKKAAKAIASGAVNAAKKLASGAKSAFKFAGKVGGAVAKAGGAVAKWVGNKIIGGANKVSSFVKPKPTGAKEYIYNPGRTNTSNVNGNKITVKDFNVNISGTIKIDAGNSSTNISAASLLKDQAFVNQLKNVIKESINNDMNGGRFMNDLATRRGQTTSSSMVGRL